MRQSRHKVHVYTVEDCFVCPQGGWWYRHCHNVNLNSGDFTSGMTWFDAASKKWLHVVKTKLSLERSSAPSALPPPPMMIRQ